MPPYGLAVVRFQEGGATWRSRDAGRTWERRGAIPGEDWERIPVALEHQENVTLLDPLLPAPGGGTRTFFLVPGLGLFRADLSEP